MRYVAAYLLAGLSAKAPTAKSVKAILESAGVEIDNDKIDVVIKAMEGKAIEEVVEEGLQKISTVPAGGATAAAAPASGGGATDAAPEKKEEAKEEEEESDDDMGFGLFD